MVPLRPRPSGQAGRSDKETCGPRILAHYRPGAGSSIARGNEFLVRRYGDRESELIRLIDNIPELVTNYYLLTHRDLQRTPPVRAFFDFVAIEIKAFRAMLSGQAER